MWRWGGGRGLLYKVILRAGPGRGPKHGWAPKQRAKSLLRSPMPRPAQPAWGRLPDLTPPTGANGPPRWSALRTGAGSGLFLRLCSPSDAPLARWLLLLLWRLGLGLGQSLGRGFRLPEQELVEQRVDRLRALQHHHVAAFIDKFQEGQEQDLQGCGAQDRAVRGQLPWDSPPPRMAHTRKSLLHSPLQPFSSTPEGTGGWPVTLWEPNQVFIHSAFFKCLWYDQGKISRSQHV